MSASAVALTIAITVLVVFTPGLVTGLAGGLRGWALAAAAPLITYAIAGLTGPWLAQAGAPFTATTFSLATAAAVAVAAGLRWLATRRASPAEADPWQRSAHLAVLGCVAAGAAVGGFTVFDGMGRLDAIPQDWDAVFHANGIRYIAETGAGGLTGMSSLNKYADGTPLFYPNAYHLVAVLVNRFAGPLAGAPMPAILNANTVLLPGLLALGLVALIRQFRGRAVLAGIAAIVVVAPQTLLYTSMSRGPLLPFLLGVALIPVAVVAVQRFLDRPAPDTGYLLVLCAAGLFTIHPSTLVSGVVFALPMLVQRWLSNRDARAAARDIGLLVAAGAGTAVVVWPHLWSAWQRPEADGPQVWPVTHQFVDAVWALLSFRHFHPDPRLGLTVALVIGLVFVARLGPLRWIAGAAVLYGAATVAVNTTNAEFVVSASQTWWNDPWRLTTLAALPLTVLAAHGIAETQAWLRDRWLASRYRPPTRIRTSAAVAVALLLGLAAVTRGYVPPNVTAIRTGYDPDWDYLVTVDEARAMLELGRIVGPGEWVMNDRFDGTTWTYALSGVRTVAAHYDEVHLADDAYLLGERFRDYRHDPAVRAAVERLNVRWVIVGKKGFLRAKQRQAGLVGHESLPFLTRVYDNPGATIYRVNR